MNGIMNTTNCHDKSLVNQINAIFNKYGYAPFSNIILEFYNRFHDECEDKGITLQNLGTDENLGYEILMHVCDNEDLKELIQRSTETIQSSTIRDYTI